MFTTRISKIVIVAVIIAVALLTASFAIAPKTAESYPDYALRHPSGIIVSVASLTGDQSPDYYQRHRDELRATRLVDTTDYFFRHPGLRGPAKLVDLTDYFFRHPEFRGN